ncbi:PucR family transcriptional regulator [Amycolatopsis sp. K13G38]|uniref:PucR family transcriptional regulator n=1 Tax=Amycolatopsis acididurans TaxID=2724524 RepID=A0ABX1IZP2_9PSEU|nr:PucR family transcriptional regulator [Amycolatopsis acididurans]NKQ51580.1 PucR family transcriptional regulator [Amycolatopsis acididurans]
MRRLPSVEDVLAFPEVQRGHPALLAGRRGMAREVTWVHVLELSGISGLLRGGEMVLLTGVALPDSNDELRRWVEELAAMGASAILIQLGERWAKLPAALVHAADAAGLPLITLRTAVPFVDITRAVLTSIVDSSHAELEESARVYEFLHRIALEGRSDTELVMAVSWLAASSIVFENRNHRVVAAHTLPEHDPEAVLRDWERRSRRDGAGEGWIISEVGARGQSWGRLIAQPVPGAQATRAQRLAVARGAETIALRRMIDGDGMRFELESRAGLLAQLARGYYRYEGEGRARAEAAGFPVNGRVLAGVAIRVPGIEAAKAGLVVERCASAARLDLLLGEDNVGLLSVPADRDPVAVLRGWARALRRELAPAVIGVGEPGTTMDSIRGSLGEAVAAARAEVASGGRRAVVRMTDVGVRGLLAQLAGDPRLQSFVERELGELLGADHAGELDALRAYLAEGRNKSAAANAVRVSRPAFYARLRRASAVLDADLEDPEKCVSLQLAFLGLESLREPDATPHATVCKRSAG